jgi:3-hydroxybutyryl-CoA dehydrogenase
VTETIVVVGAGTMGLGIAQNLLEIGVVVHICDAIATSAEAARSRIETGLLRRYKADADPAARAASDLARLDVHIGLAADVSPSIVIEAVPEIPALKGSVLADIERTYPSALIASNTSSLSIDGLAASLARPESFAGMHFFNPVPISTLVEVVVGTKSTDETAAVVRDLAKRMGKESILVHDAPGFATSRLGLAVGLEAIRMVQDGVASAEDIDTGMVLGYRHAMGPLRLTDLVGLDVRLAIAENLAIHLGPRFEPPQLLRDMVAAGKLGKKSGQGFYSWS